MSDYQIRVYRRTGTTPLQVNPPAKSRTIVHQVDEAWERFLLPTGTTYTCTCTKGRTDGCVELPHYTTQRTEEKKGLERQVPEYHLWHSTQGQRTRAQLFCTNLLHSASVRVRDETRAARPAPHRPVVLAHAVVEQRGKIMCGGSLDRGGLVPMPCAQQERRVRPPLPSAFSRFL